MRANAKVKTPLHHIYCGRLGWRHFPRCVCEPGDHPRCAESVQRHHHRRRPGRVGLDDGYAYFGFRADDPDPSRIRARYSDRDNAWSDDWVGIVLDTFNDQRRAYELFSTPLGVPRSGVQCHTSRPLQTRLERFESRLGIVYFGDRNVGLAPVMQKLLVLLPRFSLVSRARYTSPIPPVPILATML